MALTAHSEGENTSQLEKDLADALIEVGKQNMKIEGSSDDEKREKSMRNLAHPIAEAIESGSAIKVKGTATVAEINAKRDMAEGDIWAVSDTGVVTSPDGSTLNVTAGDLIRYDGAKWTQFLHLDLSGYVTTGQLNAAVATINAAIAAVSATLGSHADNKSNPHGVTAGQTGAYTKAETDAKIDDVSGGIAGHIADTSNPHSVTAGQVGAYTKTETDTKISEVGASISTHTADTSNPHSVTAEQVGAYTKEQVDGFIRNWSGYVVVPFGQEKPSASEAQLGKIYLVQVSNDPSVKDQYEEWISDGSAWSLIGTMSIDLSPYDKIVDAEAREKVINDALTAHKNDSVAHITAAERTSWNGAVSNSHTHSNKAELDKIASGDKSKWDAKQDAISDLATIRSGAAAGATAVQPSSLAKVATSGSYNDLSNKPTIPPAITIDSAMSSTSTNPVQNKVVNTALGEAKKYANHSWGGDFRTTLSPLDVYFLGPRNVFLGAYPNAIKVEYSTDGGTTWLDYGLSDAEKVCLFDFYNGKQIYCGKNSHVHAGCTASDYASVPHDLTNDNIADQRLRITISCTNGFGEGSIWLYCQLRRIGIYMSTQSASVGSTCKFSGRKRQDVSSGTDVWTLFGTYSIQGDSGWNSLPSPPSPFGAAYDGQYRELRWEIYSTKLNNSPHYSQTGCMAIIKIIGFSELMWTNSSQFRNATSQRFGGSPLFDVFSGLWRGNFEIANKLATARSLGVNLARTAASTFDGSANQLEIPVKGSLPIANGGTGASTAVGAVYNLLNGVETLDSILDENRLFAVKNKTVSSTNGVFRWFSLTKLIDLVKSKLGSLATKSSVADADISGTISDTHIASASKWNAKQDALSAMTADFVNGEWDK